MFQVDYNLQGDSGPPATDVARRRAMTHCDCRAQSAHGPTRRSPTESEAAPRPSRRYSTGRGTPGPSRSGGGRVTQGRAGSGAGNLPLAVTSVGVGLGAARAAP